MKEEKEVKEDKEEKEITEEEEIAEIIVKKDLDAITEITVKIAEEKEEEEEIPTIVIDHEISDKLTSLYHLNAIR